MNGKLTPEIMNESRGCRGILLVVQQDPKPNLPAPGSRVSIEPNLVRNEFKSS